MALPPGAREDTQRNSQYLYAPSMASGITSSTGAGRMKSTTELSIAESRVGLERKERPALQRNNSATAAPGFFANAFKTATQKSYMGVVLLESITVLVLVSIVFAKIQNRIVDDSNDQLTSIQVYLGLFILAVVFLLIVSFDALRLKNVLQLEAILIFSLSMLVYAALMQDQIRNALIGANLGRSCSDPNAVLSCPGGKNLFDSVNGLIIAVPCILAAGTVIRALLTFWLWKEFGWAIFDIVGASLSIRKLYTWYQIFACILKFDVFFFLGFSLQFLILVPGIPAVELGLTIAALPITIAAIIIGAISIRRENMIGVGFYACFVLAGMTYFIYKLVRIYQPSQSGRYTSNRRSLSLFSIVSLLMIIVTGLVSIKLVLNFGQGLSRAIPPYRKHTARKTAEEQENQGRPEID